jgi:hypothetical protein
VPLPEPHHQDALVTLYHGDCREILPERLRGERFALVTDPPYGIAHASSQNGALRGKGIHGDADLELREWWVVFCREFGGDAIGKESIPMLIFGSWKREPPPGTRHTLIWDKGLGCGMGDLTLPWKPNHEEIYVLGGGFEGHRGSSVLSGHTMVSWVSKGRNHPNQKPISLMEDLLRKIEPDRLIVDPFAGSGATLAAAKRMGRPAVGCEIDPEWLPGAMEALAPETLESQLAEITAAQEKLEIG